MAAVPSRRLAEAGFYPWSVDAGPWFRPLEDFVVTDEAEQAKLYGPTTRYSRGREPGHFGSNNSGNAVGGSTVHFAMVSLRFRPEWFRSRSLLGYGADWPVDIARMNSNAAALALAEGCEALGIAWTETPLATLSAPHTRASIAASAT